MAKISIIVPVYNGERFIHECVDSILNQSYRDFELLLLDDGSPDNCGAICDEYALRDKRVRVIHKQNEGINKTRARGVREAVGTWVVFVDDDDWLEINALENLLAESDNTDIVIGFPDNPAHKKTLSLEDCRRNIITGILIPPSPWAKLYRRALFDVWSFDFPREIDGEEDMIMNMRLFFKTSIAPHFCFKKVYNFRRNTASVSHTKKASLKHEIAYHRVRMESIPKGEHNRYMSELIFTRINGLSGIAMNCPEQITEDENGYIEAIRQDVKASGYKLSLRQRVLINSKSNLVLKTIGWYSIIKNFVRYRLGLNN